MKNVWKTWQGLLVGAAAIIALSACANQSDNQVQMQSVTHGNTDAHQMHNIDTIPSYDGPKTQTTNQFGKTTSGMGMSVYSLIGSSSLHEGGITSHVQSRLAGKGIEGVKVFVLNDTVILARAKSVISSNHYDEMQMKVLSQAEGLSGKGEPNEGIVGDKKVDSDNLAEAEEQVKAMFGGNVQILAITNPQAPELIDRIASKLHTSPADSTIAKDISKLLQMHK